MTSQARFVLFPLGNKRFALPASSSQNSRVRIRHKRFHTLRHC